MSGVPPAVDESSLDLLSRRKRIRYPRTLPPRATSLPSARPPHLLQPPVQPLKNTTRNPTAKGGAPLSHVPRILLGRQRVHDSTRFLDAV